MTDLERAQAMRKLAHVYHDYWLFNIVPLGDDKRPVITGVSASGQPLRFRWEQWQTQRQTQALFKQILRPAWWTQVYGIAAVCGPVSGNLACIDFDDSPWEAVGNMLDLLETPLDYAWTVRTPGGGWHLWLRLSNDVDKTLTLVDGIQRTAGKYGGAVELRYTGHYTALPGSRHPNGGTYEFVFNTPPELEEAL